jgi:hypothetical protein
LLGVGLVLLFYARCVANIAATGYNKHTGYRVKEGVDMSVKVKVRIPAKRNRKSASQLRQTEVRTEYVCAPHRSYAEDIKFLTTSFQRDIEDLDKMSPKEAKAVSLARLKKYGILDESGRLIEYYDR